MISSITRVATTAAIILTGADSLPLICEAQLNGLPTTEATIAVRRAGVTKPVAFIKTTDDSLILLRAEDGRKKTIKARGALFGDRPAARERILREIEQQVLQWT